MAGYPKIEKYTPTDKRSAAVALSVSFDDIRSALNAALRERFPADDDIMGPWVVDVFDDYVVYEIESELYRIGYAYASGEATLIGDPVRVLKSYVPAEGADSGMLSADQLDADTLTLALDVAEGDPPSSFRLFGKGTTRTTKGDLLFDEEAAASVMAALSDHGKADLPIDYGHGMLAMIKTPETGVAAGWFKPAVVNDELWATEVQWTPRADKALRAREYRYHSPAVKFHPDTRRVTKLVNVALTNLHATKGLQPLVASEHEPSAPGSGAEEVHAMSEKLFARLGAKDEAEATIMLAEHEMWMKEVLANLDCTKLDEAVPAIAALRVQAAEATKLAEQIVTLTSERDALAEAESERKQSALIAELSEAGKLPPALHDWAKTITIEQLAEFGEKAVVSDKKDPAAPKPAASSEPEVTPQMLALAKQLNVSLDEIKANLAAKAAE